MKVITGNASDKEVNEVNNWANASADNRRQYHYLKTLWEKSHAEGPAPVWNENKAWLNVKENIHRPKSKFSILQIAASLLLLASLGVGIKFIFSGEEKIVQEVKPVYKEKEQQHQEEQRRKEKTVAAVAFSEIETSDSIKEVILEDSSLVILNVNSKIRYQDFDRLATRMLYLKGQAYFDVNPGKKDFIVAAGPLKVKVVGTAFSINEAISQDTIEIIVDEGVVEVYEAKNRKNTITISAKQKYSFSKKEHTFTSGEYSKKTHWWKSFVSRLKQIIDRIKHRRKK